MTRGEYRSKVLRVLGVGLNDGFFREFGLDTEDTINDICYEGLKEAQYHLVTNAGSRRWVKEVTLTNSDITTHANGYYTYALPSDVMRLDGDYETISAFTTNGSSQWGHMAPLEMIGRSRGDVYAIENNKIRFAPGSRDPAGLTLRYFYWVEQPDDDQDILDFPDELIRLAVYESAVIALGEEWVPIPPRSDKMQKIHAYRNDWRKRAASRERRTKAPHYFHRGTSEATWGSQHIAF